MKIYNKEGLVISGTEEFSYSGKFMGERFVSCNIKSPSVIPFDINDYIEYRGERFFIDRVPSVKKVSSEYSCGDAFQYELKFISLKYELERCSFLDVVLNDNNVHYSSSPVFSFYGEVTELANRIQANLNRLYPGQWHIIVDSTVASNLKNISVSDSNCWNALSMVYSEYGINYTVNGRNIVIGDIEHIISHKFKYGKDNGLYDISRSVDEETSIVTRMRAYGANKNLPEDYNKEEGSLVPESQYIPGLMLPGYSATLIDYIDSENIIKYGTREASVTFEDIYPTIAGIEIPGIGRIDEIVSSEKITDPKQPTFKVKIKDIGFNINDYLTPDTATLSATSGALAGYDFEIIKCTKITNGYELELSRDNEDRLPDDKINFTEGDTFVLLNITMPDIYVKAAEDRLLIAAKQYLADYDHEIYTYLITTDSVFMARHTDLSSILKEGNIITITDEDLGFTKDIIIQSLSIKEDPTNLPKYEITINDKPLSSTLERIKSSLLNVENTVSISLNQIQNAINGYDNRFIRKDKSDVARRRIRFEEGIDIGEYNSKDEGYIHYDGDAKLGNVLLKSLLSEGYTEGINGFLADQQGHVKARSLSLTDFLETPELRYNKVTVIGEEQWATTGGVIEDILIDGNEIDNKYRVKLKLEEGDINPFFEGDICKGIFNTSTGFRTVFFNIVSSSDEPGFSSGIMDVVMTGYMVPPQRAMTIARIGNLLYDVVDGKTVARYPDRQRSMLISAKKGYTQWYDKVDTWNIQVKHIVKHEGECKNVGLPGVPVGASGYISWGTSVYIKGNVTQIDVNDNVVPEVTPVEDWIEGKRYTKNNQVTLLGCIYLCVADFSVTKPKYDNPDWFMTVGNPNFIMTFDSSEGWTFIGDNIDTTITATVTKYNQDMTSDIPSAQFSWTRTSSDPDSDIIWNAQHLGFGNTIHLIRNDLPGYGMRKISFTCTAVIDIDNTISNSFSA